MKGKTKVVRYPWDDKYIPDYNDFIELKEHYGVEQIIIRDYNRREYYVSGNGNDNSDNSNRTGSTGNNSDD